MQRILSKNVSGVSRLFLVIFLITLTIYIINYYLQTRSGALSTTLGIDATPDLLVQLRSLSAIVIVALTIIYNIIYIPRPTYAYAFLMLLNIQYLYYTITADLPGGMLMYVNYYTSMSLWIYIYMFFYAFFRKNSALEIDKYIIFYVLLCAVLFILNFYSLNSAGISWQYIESYFLITSVPLILGLKKHKSALIWLIVICSLLAAKRTGFITLILTLFFAANFNKLLSPRFWKSFPKYVFISIILLSLCHFVLGDEVQTLFDRFANISEDGGSGRDMVYADVWNMIKASNYSHLIFGHGYNKVMADADLAFSAHNDFLEILYDFGICGLFAFCGFVASASNIRTYRTFSYPQKSALLVFVILSLFSHLVLVTSYVIPILVFWAYVPSKKPNMYNNLTPNKL